MRQAENATGPTAGPYRVEGGETITAGDPAGCDYRMIVEAYDGVMSDAEKAATLNLMAASWDFFAACTPERLDALEKLLAAAAEYCYDDRIAGDIGAVEELARDLRAACGRVRGEGVTP